MKSFTAALYKRILHLLFPRECVGCSCDLAWNAEGFLCPACKRELKVPGPLICQRCGTVLKAGGAHCYACRGSRGKRYKCKIIRSAWQFNAPSRALIHALKYGGLDYLAPLMAEDMVHRFSQLKELAGADLIVPVPLHRLKLRQRGYNQSELLARCFARKTGLPFLENGLVRVRNTPSQTALNRAGRLENMTGAFSCVRPEAVKGRTVLLIDDVATTGATLEGCAQALKQGGAKQVLAYTYARE